MNRFVLKRKITKNQIVLKILFFIILIFYALIFTGCKDNQDLVTEIYTSEDFLDMNNNLDGSFLMMQDIDLDGYKGTSVINDFSGTLDGNGYRVMNFTIDARDKKGSFFTRLNNAEIKNIIIEDYKVDYVHSLAFSVISTECRNSVIDNVKVDFSGRNISEKELLKLQIDGIGGIYNSTIMNSEVLIDLSEIELANSDSIVVNGIGIRIENSDIVNNVIKMNYSGQLDATTMIVVSGLAINITGSSYNKISSNIIFLSMDIDSINGESHNAMLNINSLSRHLFYEYHQVDVKENIIVNNVSVKNLTNNENIFNPFIYSVILFNEETSVLKNVIYGSMMFENKIVNDSGSFFENQIKGFTEESVYSESSFPGWTMLDSSYLRSSQFFKDHMIELTELEELMISNILEKME